MTSTNQQTPRGPGPGGFFTQTYLPSPAPSNISTTSVAGLPHPRTNPLRPGSAKEENVRRFIEGRLLEINRRAVKKFGFQEPGSSDGEEDVGFRSMGELCRELDVVLNILWQTGTPSLQVPYFMNIASEMTTWLGSLAPSPATTFSTLRKLDHCFASLLAGRDVETGDPLPGFDRGPAMSRTDMVRCRSLVEQTRVLMVDVMNKAGADCDEDGDEDNGNGSSRDKPRAGDAETTDGDTTMDEGNGTTPSQIAINEYDDDDDEEEEEEELEMDVARVYEKTLVRLGAMLGEGPGVGIV